MRGRAGAVHRVFLSGRAIGDPVAWEKAPRGASEKPPS
jgi:hypothetical protein